MQRLLLSAVLLGLAASPAFAHSGAGHTHSFAAGFGHPLGGLDHILAMVTVGLWGALVGGRALWAWPAAFVGTMIVGFAVAASGTGAPFVEPAILASGIALGLAVMLAVKAPVWAGALIAGAFAFFHGQAHGSEAGGGAALIPYAAGFAIATATLHLAGIGLGLAADGRMGRLALRGAGAAVVLAGVAIAAGAL
jgi:urease accessory protein